MSGRQGRLPVLWSVVLALLLLWPALGRGYVLSYDMVWVPDLALRSDFLGLGSALPRAVPSDAVVSVLDEVIPGMLLQKVVLLGALVFGSVGAARLVPESTVVGRLVAVTLFEWSPFVAERLVIGHWPVLLGYAVVPWLVLAARRMRVDGRVRPAVGWLLLAGSLSPSAGVATAVVVLTHGLRRTGWRTNLLLLGLVAGANAPWVVSGLLHAGTATSDPVGARVFALHAEGSVPGPVAALSLGGIWNSEVVPPSRTGALGWATAVVVVALAVAGARRWSALLSKRERVATAGCWLLGWGLATVTWLAPSAVGWLAGLVPGGGLVRDGSRLLTLCMPALVGLTACGAAALCQRAAGRVAPLAWGTALVLLPLALMPDVAGGMAGRLRSASYPPSYAAAREAVEGQASGSGGEVLVLPFTSYRAPGWNHGHKVLDPLGRYLTPNFVASDRLVVSGSLVEGEDARGPSIRRALRARAPALRSRLLADQGISLVVTERDTGQRAPSVAGRTVLDGPDLSVVRLGHPTVRPAPASWLAAMSAAWGAFLLVGVTSILLGRTSRRQRSACNSG